MKYSIILGTLNRSVEITNCLQSLRNQTETDFEIIIVDQSDNLETQQAIEKFNDLNIRYYRVDFKGLSKARNYGMQHASGDYFCLVDDDAEYRSDYLTVVNNYSAIYHHAVLSGIIISNIDHKTPFIDCSKVDNLHTFSSKELLRYAPSAALVFPQILYKAIGDFDERLGVGNNFASGEETDYLLRAIDCGFQVIHCKDMVVYHPIKNSSKNYKSIIQHAMGKGALFKIDFFERGKKRLCGFAVRNTIGMLVKTLANIGGNYKLYAWRFKGFVIGFKTFEAKR